MTERTVTVRELRNHGGRVLDEVSRGATLLVTRDGAPVAELRAIRRKGLSATELVARRSHLPDMDLAALRRELDDLLDMSL